MHSSRLAARLLTFLSPLLLLLLTVGSLPEAWAEEGGEDLLYKIEGKVVPPDSRPARWHSTVTLVVDGGKRRAFLKEDNTFQFNGLPSGTYLIEVENSDYFYEPIRVDINSKGKHRARKNSLIQPNQVSQLPYPLKMKPISRFNYFQKREEWKITDVLFNPMMMMMFLPLILITVLPKMMQDPDTKKEMEEMQAKMNVQNQMPEMSELFTQFFGGGQPQKKSKPLQARRRRD